MERNEILRQVNEIFKDVLDVDDLIISEQTKADDVDEWDSLSHIQLIVAIEKHFKIKFIAAEINAWKNVGEMISSIITKQ